MKKAIFFILILSSINVLAQKSSLDKKLDELYRSNYFKALDLILTPEMFNPGKDSNISYIEFLQDSTANFNDSERVYASIDAGQSQDLNYIIGTIGDYQSGEKMANVIIKKVYNDGSTKIEKLSIIFDDILPPSTLEAEYAQYSVDVDIVGDNIEWL